LVRENIYRKPNFWLDEKIAEFKNNPLNPSYSELITDLLTRYFKESETRKYRAQKPELIPGPIPTLDRYWQDQMNGYSLEETVIKNEITDRKLTDIYVSARSEVDDIESSEILLPKVISMLRQLQEVIV
jgi:hypothetical protein